MEETYKAKGLSDDEIKELSEMYTFIDNGGDEGIDKNDMIVGFQKLGITITAEKNEELYSKYDHDKSGDINKAEFFDMVFSNKGSNTLNKDGIIAVLKTLA